MAERYRPEEMTPRRDDVYLEEEAIEGEDARVFVPPVGQNLKV
jgi:hypothetical protein